MEPRSASQLAVIIKVTPLVDTLVEAHGFRPDSIYVEYCWLGVLGPTSTFAYRRLGLIAAATPAGSEAPVDLVDLAVSLGLGEGTGRNSLMARALRRLVQFGAAEWRGDALAVRRALAPLTVRQLGRLGFTARAMHHRITEQHRAGGHGAHGTR